MEIRFFKYLLLFAFALASSNIVFSQGDLLILGVVRDEASSAKLETSLVAVKQDGTVFDNMTTAKNGKYEFTMPLGHVYQLRFSKQGFGHKILQFDTKNMNPEDFGGGFEMVIDVTLFQVAEEFNMTILDAPQGKSSYDPISNSIAWDNAYTEKMRYKVEDEKKRVEDLIENREKNQKDFDQLMAKAEDKMMEDKYEEAVNKFKAALKIFPNDVKAKERLAIAEQKLEDSKKNKALDTEYAGHIADGNKAMKDEEWADAKSSFEAALDLKPGEQVPTDKLKDINDILSNMMKRGEYNELVDEADKKFNSEDYAGAIKKYEEALKLMSTETYPREKIKEAEKIMKSESDALADQEKLDKEYDELMKFAAKNVKDEKYEIALDKYSQASDLKPKEDLPKKKIEELNQLLAELAALKDQNDKDAADKNASDKIEKEYNDLIDAGNDLFKDKDFSKSREKFVAALGVKPNDKYAENKISTIDKMLEDLAANAEEDKKKKDDDNKNAEIEKEYKALIDKADGQFDSKNWDSAKRAYQQALEVKENEKYPKSRITRIDELIAAEEKDKNREDELANLDDIRKEEERKRQEEEDRIANELAEKKRKLEELRNQKNSDENASKNDNRDYKTIDGDSDADVIKFFKDARKKEEIAKLNNVNDIKAREKKRAEDLNSQSNRQRQDNQNDIESKNESMEAIALNGKDYHDKSVRNLEDVRDQNEENIQDYTKKSDYKRERNIDEVEDKQAGLIGLSTNDRYRKMKVESVDSDRERIKDQQKSYASKGDANRVDNVFAVDTQKEEVKNMKFDGENTRLENVESVNEEQEEIKRYYNDLVKASDVKRERNIDDVENDKEKSLNIGNDKGVHREESISDVQMQKSKMNSFTEDMALDASMRRLQAMEDLEDKGKSPKKDSENYNLDESDAGVEYGVTETSREQGNKTIIVRTVRNGNKIDNFKKVISKTGIYYFKNGISITSDTWELETVLVHD